MTRFISEQNLWKSAGVSLLLAAGVCLVFWIVRIFYNISFVTPYLAVTTGGEEECLFSIWKFIQHQAVYADPHRIPFAVSCYNWGFYCFYGLVTKACLHLFHLDEIWIAAVGRLMTAIFTLMAGAIFYLAQRRFAKYGFFASPAVSWAWCLIAACSPLVGFWSITVRPDLGALAFECAGLYVILHYVSKPNDRLIVAAVVLFYAAWAFKQSQVTMLAGSALSLLLLKRWRAFFLLSSAWWLLVILTFILGGPIYRESVLSSQGHLPMAMDLGVENARMALLRNLFLPLGLASTLWILWRRARRVDLEPAATVVTAAFLFSFCFALVTAFKVGAVTNYYIPAAWISMLALAVHWERIHSRWTLAGVVICSLLMTCGVARAHVAYGEYRYGDFVHRAVAEKLRHLPGPVFVADVYADLPWVQHLSPNFVIAGTYSFDQAAGVPFEGGGVEGLMRVGYFGTLVVNQSDPPSPSVLEKYELDDEYRDAYSDLGFYRRVGLASH